MRDDEIAISLLTRELDFRRGCTMVTVTPANEPRIVQAMYGLGARNCELHVAQSTGPRTVVRGVMVPTFMPETA